MQYYKIFVTQKFESKLKKCNNEFKVWFEKILDQLTKNPFLGKPIYSKWIREKKYNKFRIYYIIEDEFKIVYFIDISEKKDQQKIIDSIIELKEFYMNEIKKSSSKLNEVF